MTGHYSYAAQMSIADLDALLLIYADALDDLEKARIAAANRLSALTRTSDNHGKGMAVDSPPALALAGLVDGLAALEHKAELELKRAFRKHPLGEWQRRTVGIGDRQLPRLLAAIGEPYWNTLHNRPRTVSELWAFCGMHTVPGQIVRETLNVAAGDRTSCEAQAASVPGDHLRRDAQKQSVAGDDIQIAGDTQGKSRVAPRRRKGQQSNWSNIAKMRIRLIAAQCIRYDNSPYRAVYDKGRAKYALDEITEMHKHNRALRLVAKEILKDLWAESRRLSLATTPLPTFDAATVDEATEAVA